VRLAHATWLSMDLNRHSLKKFLAVVEELNFNRAAEILHVSQPALSQAIHRLEVDLGKNLFERNSHGVKLTEFGKAFHAIARTLVAQHDRAVASALDAARDEVKALRVAHSPLVDMRTVAAIRSEFTKSDNARINVTGLPDAEQIALLRAGKLDIVLLLARVMDEVLGVGVLTRKRTIIGLHRDRPLTRAKRIVLDDIRQEPLIWWPRGFHPRLFDWFSTILGSEARLHWAQPATTLPEMLELVARGFGITLLPRSAAQFRHVGVVFRALADHPFTVETVSAVRKDNDSEFVREFVAWLRSPCAPRSPRTFAKSLDDPSATSCGSVKSGALLTNTRSFTIRLTRSKSPIGCCNVANSSMAASRAACLPSWIVSWSPNFPHQGLPSFFPSRPDKKIRLPLRTNGTNATT
jgi:DNA-binding transcriptional LysR family regulator